MKSTKTMPKERRTDCSDALGILMEPEEVGRILREDAGIDWPDHCGPTDVRIERAWPRRDGGFAVEWSFRLGDGQRQSLYGGSRRVARGERAPQACGPDGNSRRLPIHRDSIPPAAQTGSTCDPSNESSQPEVTAQGLRRLFVDLPRWNMLIHTPDSDPEMPHLLRCFDESEMAELLNPHWEQATSRCEIAATDPHRDRRGAAARSRARPVSKCGHRLLGYRAGRRAAIAYQLDTSTAASVRLVGKTYRTDRGRDLLRLHRELNDELTQASRGRVRVPAPVAYLPDLQMAVYAWSEGRQSEDDTLPLIDVAAAAVDALAVLHGVAMDGLRDFAVADELAIVSSWHEALGQVDPHLSDEVAHLVDALRLAGESSDTSRKCTIHRDCYQRQFSFADDVTTLLDLDTLARGDPCVDVGNLLAHLSLAALSPEGSFDDATSNHTRGRVCHTSLAETVVRGYGDSRGRLDRETLAFYWASALFRVGAIHALRTSGKIHAPALWTLADAVLMYTPSCNLIGHGKRDRQGVEFDPHAILRLVPA